MIIPINAKMHLTQYKSIYDKKKILIKVILEIMHLNITRAKEMSIRVDLLSLPAIYQLGVDRHITFLALDSLFCKTLYLYLLSMVTVRIDTIILYSVLAW